ncbi:MAG: modification methylase [Gemmatimonadales bacterium]|nr:modification methylase [Candidatus Palauibacter irciniicola]MYC17581.1 modification methylase [Gemmatimonadales bacterium]
MPDNRALHAAIRAKKDEFYTQLGDIENELRYYREHFVGKVVYCNCDDPTVSNFYRYFKLSFKKLRLKKLVTTCYKNQQPNLFSQHDAEQAVGVEYDGETERVFHLEGDGDFRSDECIALLEQADVVVTNPPFSLFREYIAQLVEYDKKFLVIGNMNAATYKEVFPLIQANKLWYGASIKSGDREFGVPSHYPLTAAGARIDNDGNKFVRVKGVRWFVNLDHVKRHEDLVLFKRYTPDEYPTYDNFDAINVNKTAHIPVDYAGAIGVPITFLDKHNPDQFELVWTTDRGGDGMLDDIKLPHTRYDAPVVDGKGLYKRVIIRNRRLLR